MQILPSKELLPFIKHYLFLESEGTSIKKLRLFSDGNTGVVFSFKSSLISDAKNDGSLNCFPNSFVYGQITEFKDLYLVSEASLIIVVFQPSGINLLMGIPADELRDNIIRTEELFGWQGVKLQEKLSEQANFKERLKLLNTFFTELIAKKSFTNQTLIQASLNFIIKNRGVISINQLVKYTGYTERHIERKFSEAIGLNPKKFSSIIKLHSFLGYLKENPKNFTVIAYEAGYSDQSHLIKEFKKYTGMTPTEYVNIADKLTINFVELYPSKTKSENSMSDLYNLPGNPIATFVQHLNVDKYVQSKNFDSSI